MSTRRSLKDIQVTGEDARTYLDGAWQHCLRCRLAEHRAKVDYAQDKHFGVVPASEKGSYAWGAAPDRTTIPERSVWHFLLEAPDTIQQEKGMFACPHTHQGDVFDASPNSSFLDLTFGILDGRLPAAKTECSFSFAMGCRPIDFLNTHRLVKPSSTAAKRCRPRWSLELAMASPVLTYISGPNALACVRPDLGTKFSVTRGEVIPFQVQVNRSPERMPEMMTLYGYVGPSIDTVLRTGRDDQLYEVGEWDAQPCHSPSTEPMLDWLWHFTWYMWLTEAARQQIFEEATTLPNQLVELTETLNRFYEDKSYGMADIQRFLDQIQGDHALVRRQMELGDVNEEGSSGGPTEEGA